MPNSLLDLYRKYNEENGIVDDTPDYFVVKDVLGPWAQKNPRIREAFPDFAKEYDAIREANSPGTFGGLKNTARTAFDRSRQALNVIGGEVDADDVAKLERDVQARPSSVPWEDWQRTEGEEARKVFMRDPLEITANIITSGFAGSLPALAGGLSLGAAGALAGPAGGIAGAAVGTGAGSLAVEYGGKYLDVLRDEGADLTNPESIRRILEDPEVRAKARGLAYRRGIPVAVFDAASAGLAGKIFKGFTGATRGQIVGQGLAEGGVQAVFDAGGEITGALSAGERISPGAVFEEVAGGAGPTLVEVGGAAMRRNITNRPATPGAGPAGGLETPNRMEDPIIEPEAEVPAGPTVRTNREAVLAAYAIPDEQVAARVAELQALPVLSADQNVEMEILLSRAPATPEPTGGLEVVAPVAGSPAAAIQQEKPSITLERNGETRTFDNLEEALAWQRGTTTPVASETAAAAPGFGILPGAPTPLATEPLVETPAAVGAPVGVPAPSSVEQPNPAAAAQPTVAPTLEQDLARYGEIQQQWVALLQQGVPTESPQIQALWQENEEIKNRYGGMPPVAPSTITQPAQPDVQIPEPVIPPAPVVEADAAVRLLDPDQQVAQPVEQAGVEPPGQIPVVPPEPIQDPVVVTPFDESRGELPPTAVQPLEESNSQVTDALAAGRQRMVDEARGQGMLDELEFSGRTPRQVVADFWASTYQALNPQQRRKIERYIEQFTGLKVGDVISYNPTTKEEVRANSYADLYGITEAPDEVYFLEGTERGLIALMEFANKAFSTAAPQPAKPAPALPPKEAAPVVAATPDFPKPSALAPTVPSAALTPDEQAAVVAAQVPGVEPVMIPQGGSSAAYDTVMGIYAAEKHFTLWLAQRNPNTGQLGRWHYIGILGQNKEQARERAIATAKKIGRGDMTGVAFIGKDQFRQPTALGVFETTLTEAELTGIEKTALGNQQIGFGKNAGVLVKDIWAKDQKWAMWAATSMTSGRGKQIAEYIRALPEYIIAQDAAKVEVADALTGDVQQVLKDFQLTGTAQGSGNILVGGNTYEWKDTIKQFGGRFDGETKSWSLAPAKFAEFVAKLRTLPRVAGGPGASLPAHASDPRLGKLREDADRRPDRSGFEQPVSQYIGDDTAALLSLGEKVGMPRIVIDEQIEDVARINRGYRDGKKLFLLASQPGSGKTFVLGAAIRELRRSGAKKITYVTLRKELITQIQKDLEAYGIGEVEFITYPEMRTRATATSDVLIFDEAHAVKNVGGGQDEVQQAEKAKQWIKNAKFTLLSTATPFENPVQAAYLEPTGIFDDPFGSFEEFAMAYGARRMSFKDGSTQIIWKRGPMSDMDSKAAREFFRKEGVFTSRKTRLPQGMVDSRMVKVMADPAAERRYTLFSDAAAETEGQLFGFAVPWITNFQKRLLEAAKVQRGIAEADAALARGRFPIIFVETKAERNINIPELQDKEDAYDAAVAMAISMRDKPPARKEFGLPPKGIVEVLTAYMNKSGESEIVIPSAEELIKAHFGDRVAIFTGSVTPKKAQENLDAWRRGEKPVIVATMAKGGTGLSLHDKVGNHPTTQINVNLPWSATAVVQVAQRSARYGLQSPAEMQWIFADNIPFDRMLASRVGGRMADMGSLVHGEKLPGAAEIEAWSFDNKLFSETKAEAQEVAAAPASAPQPTGVTPEYLARDTFEELRGQPIELNGEKLDAADAWAETQKALRTYQKLLHCLST